MDIATLVGLVLGLGLVGAAIAMGGGGLMPFVDMGSVMIVIGGTCAALLVNYPMANVLSSLSVVKNCSLTSIPNTTDIMAQFSELAGIARRDGLLALVSRGLPESVRELVVCHVRHPFGRAESLRIASGILTSSA